MKIEFQKIVNLLGTTSDDKDLPRFVTKKQIEVCVQSGINYDLNKEIRIKTPMLRSDLCDFSDAYIVMKGTVAVTAPDDAKRNKSIAFKNNAPFINCIYKINGVQIDNQKIQMLVLVKLVRVGKNKTEVVIPLKHLSNFRRTLNISLINCETEFILTWSKFFFLINFYFVCYNPIIQTQKRKIQ